MIEAVTLAPGFEEFTAVVEQLNFMIRDLRSKEVLSLQHGDVEKLIAKNGNEICRRFLQSYFDGRQKGEILLESVKGADGLERNHRKKNCARSLMSLFGEVEIKRIGYGRFGSQNLFPLHAELNLPSKKYSHGLQKRVAEESAKSSFDQAVESVDRTSGGAIPKRQAEESVVNTTQDFEAYYESRGIKRTEETDDLLILSIDGKGIVMRQEGLRPATKKAAENEQHKLKTRLSRGEKRNRKRMATVAAVARENGGCQTPLFLLNSRVAGSFLAGALGINSGVALKAATPPAKPATVCGHSLSLDSSGGIWRKTRQVSAYRICGVENEFGSSRKSAIVLSEPSMRERCQTHLMIEEKSWKMKN